MVYFEQNADRFPNAHIVVDFSTFKTNKIAFHYSSFSWNIWSSPCTSPAAVTTISLQVILLLRHVM